MKTNVIDVETSRTPAEGSHNPTWPTRLFLLILLRVLLVLVLLPVGAAGALSGPRHLRSGGADVAHTCGADWSATWRVCPKVAVSAPIGSDRRALQVSQRLGSPVR
jgi:hypothetical protein